MQLKDNQYLRVRLDELRGGVEFILTEYLPHGNRKHISLLISHAEIESARSVGAILESAQEYLGWRLKTSTMM